MATFFPLGRVVATPAAYAQLERLGVSASSLLARHATGDWGDLCDADRKANVEALSGGARLMSVYPLDRGITVWVITDAADDEGQRFSTTILLPEEY